ncbi:MAG: hypothetical protein AMJ73_04315 [candidate division Zixibacteria bacterium SM1_73]|nr:MAG: hypothetical protein AMJ73_04315 [candidate division Zixibacteria bacterium SM1_73]
MKKFSNITMLVVLSVVLAVTNLLCCHRSKDSKNKQSILECYKFADDHWSEEEYKYWLWDSVYNREIDYAIVSDTFPYRDAQGNKTYHSHHLPDKKIDQYYEMIGKYDQFRFGWDDFPEEGLQQKRRNEYLDCLDRATKNKRVSPTRVE